MKGRPYDDRALDFSAYISLIGPTPYALHTWTDFFFGKLYTRECAHTIDLPIASKGLVMDAHRVTLKDGSPPGS